MVSSASFDPHITLRAGADLFFVLVAIASASVPFIVPQPAPHRRWHSLLGPTLTPGTRPFAQLTVAELDLGSEWANAESAVAIGVEDADGLLARAELALYRSPTGLHGVLLKPLDAIDDEATALLWRGLALCASSLRLRSLHPVDGAAFQGRQLKWAGRLSEKLEIERATNSHVAGSHIAASTETNPASGAIRLTPGTRVPSWKRASDLLIGATAALVTAPLWLIVALVVRRSSPGPVLFRQVRIGAGGLPFQMYKFRTMYLDNDDSAHREQNRLELLGEAPAVKDACDVRITGIGRWLRRLSLDELPQLLNVARADMSLVGPRPSLMWEVELFEQSKRRRMDARPGLTGLWQVSGRGDISMSEMLDLDLDYVADIRPMVDARCLAATARSVLDGRGAR